MRARGRITNHIAHWLSFRTGPVKGGHPPLALVFGHFMSVRGFRTHVRNSYHVVTPRKYGGNSTRARFHTSYHRYRFDVTLMTRIIWSFTKILHSFMMMWCISSRNRQSQGGMRIPCHPYAVEIPGNCELGLAWVPVFWVYCLYAVEVKAYQVGPYLSVT